MFLFWRWKRKRWKLIFFLKLFFFWFKWEIWCVWNNSRSLEVWGSSQARTSTELKLKLLLSEHNHFDQTWSDMCERSVYCCSTDRVGSCWSGPGPQRYYWGRHYWHHWEQMAGQTFFVGWSVEMTAWGSSYHGVMSA